MTTPLVKFTSSQAPNAQSAVQAILGAISQRAGVHIEWQSHADWRAREQAFDRGEIQMAWVCGLPYVWKADDPEIDIELLAAPVMAAPRYQEKAIYFSDVVVKKESPFQYFRDLKGHSWAINEPESHSGYNITRYHLASIGEDADFFSHVIAAGAHQLALRKVLHGEVDASAIDSTVLETELHLHPEFGEQIRIIEQLGPSPIPPWLIHRSIDKSTRSKLRAALLDLHTDPQGQQILKLGNYSHFTRVNDHDYAPIRSMEERAKTIKLL